MLLRVSAPQFPFKDPTLIFFNVVALPKAKEVRLKRNHSVVKMKHAGTKSEEGDLRKEQ